MPVCRVCKRRHNGPCNLRKRGWSWSWCGRPMETSDSTLKVQFHSQRRLSNGVSELVLLTQPKPSHRLYRGKAYSLPRLTGTFGENGKPGYQAITSGDVFTITTPDSRSLPLPS